MSRGIETDKRYVEYIAKSAAISIIAGVMTAHDDEITVEEIKQEAFRMIADGVKYADEHITSKTSIILEMLKSTSEEQKLKDTLLKEKEEKLNRQEESINEMEL